MVGKPPKPSARTMYANHIGHLRKYRRCESDDIHPSNTLPNSLHHLLCSKYHLWAYANPRSDQSRLVDSSIQGRSNFREASKVVKTKGGLARLHALYVREEDCHSSQKPLLWMFVITLAILVIQRLLPPKRRTYSHRRLGVGGVGVDVGVKLGYASLENWRQLALAKVGSGAFQQHYGAVLDSEQQP